MPTIIATVRKGLRLALTAVLTLAVLLGSSGVHTTTQCADHEHAAGSAALAVDLDAPDDGHDGDNGLCLDCDCGCQPVMWNEAVALVQPAVQPACLHRGPGQLTPDDVVFEIEPPPVLAS
jgi:hypothetical protein